MNDYPKAMYAANGDQDVWGKQLKVLVVADEDHELAAMSEGYVDHPHKLTEEEVKPPKSKTTKDT